MTVRSSHGPSHQVIINNVRWVDTALRFDEYGYSDRKESPSAVNPTGEDPTNGRLTVMTLAPTDDPDRLKWTKEYHDPAFIATETAALTRGNEE